MELSEPEFGARADNFTPCQILLDGMGKAYSMHKR
jgi:hypothetical protein